MATRTKRFKNGIILKPGNISEITSVPAGTVDNVNGLLTYDNTHKLIAVVADLSREIITADQNQILKNKTISTSSLPTSENTINVFAEGVTSTELNAALGELAASIENKTGAETDIFNNTITLSASASSITGLLHHRLTNDVELKEARVQLFGKNNVYLGDLQIDVKKNTTPDDVGMLSVFSPTGKPTIKFQVTEPNLTYANPQTNTSALAVEMEIQTINLEKKLLLSGDFTYLTPAKKNLIRFNENGTEDTQFTANAVVFENQPTFNDTVRGTKILSDNKILVWGRFTNYKNSGQNLLIKLNEDGTFDPNDTFNLNIKQVIIGLGAITQITTLEVDELGNVYIAIPSGTQNLLLKVNSFGSLVASFNNGGLVQFSASITDMAYKNSSVFVVGNFLNQQVANTNRIIKLDSTTGSGDFSQGSFNSNIVGKFNNQISSIVVKDDNSVVVSGYFTNFYSVTGVNQIVSLQANGIENATFSNNIKNKFTNSQVDTLKLYNNQIFLQDVIASGLVISKNLKLLNSDGTEDLSFKASYDKIKTDFSIPTPNISFAPISITGNDLYISVQRSLLGAIQLYKLNILPERYNEYSESIATVANGKIQTLNASKDQYLRLDITNIPTGYAGTIQVTFIGVKI